MTAIRIRFCRSCAVAAAGSAIAAPRAVLTNARRSRSLLAMLGPPGYGSRSYGRAKVRSAFRDSRLFGNSIPLPLDSVCYPEALAHQDHGRGLRRREGVRVAGDGVVAAAMA